MIRYISFLCYLIFFLCCISLHAQKPVEAAKVPVLKPSALIVDSVFSGLKLRNIGPAMMSGRIADIAIHPEDDNLWYVAVGSGGVWKTVNAGVTWTPVFDSQTSYSIGCVTIDPSYPDVVWVGTGENVGGRHVGYGDGIYRSDDGGAHWKNMGLKSSEHISKIIVHPNHSEVVWVAVQGPLWAKGGERGVYKTMDGGITWKRTLGDTEWVGATDIAMDPRDPDLLYAATWQRHRTVANYIGGGPGTGIYRSQNGGETWTKLTAGLPTSNMGKIGLAISPQQPDIIYAAIELNRKTGGVFRSENRGSTWEKRSDAVSGATGPHYYQELYASPHQFDRIYLMDNMMQVSEDGGTTFTQVNSEHKHVDNHAIAFRKDDPDYLMVGTDGGLYESFDLAKNWRFMQNLPVTQFYKVAVDDTYPFYNIYGGTQDNSTQGGPSRTDNVQGIQNSDWRVILNWDGHQTATEPGNPNIVYAERQEGQLSRIDMMTGEVTDIQPQSGKGETYQRFNWDAPILVSPHAPTRIFFASQRLWKSENRGDLWEPISGDLTRNQERFSLPIMGKIQSWDEPWDVNAMSTYNTITSIAESPVQEGLIYVGTDDGLIQVTEDGGAVWKKIEVGSISGIPATSFVNDIKADLFDAGTVYVALDNHKYGDFNPYLIRSTDRGRTWTSIRSNLPNRTLVWRLVQDHEKKELMFLGTEFGIYFTINGGTSWVKIKGDAPTISFRDLAIQRREDDLIGASFGRGFFILDDYSPLREISEEQMAQEATLFNARKAWWYIPRSHLSFDEPKGSMGASHYVAPNPPFGAVFTYYLKEGLKTSKDLRKEKEKSLRTGHQDIQFPGWETIDAERAEDRPRIWLTISDTEGNVIRRIEGSNEAGMHRLTWDLKYPASTPIRLDDQTKESEFNASGFMAAPGIYSATLSKQVGGKVTPLSNSINLVVEQMRLGALPGASPKEVAAFWRTYESLVHSLSAVQLTMNRSNQRLTALQKGLRMVHDAPGLLDQQVFEARQEMIELDREMNGNASKREIGEKTNPTVGERMFKVYLGIGNSTQGPTQTNRNNLDLVREDLKSIQARLEAVQKQMESIAVALLKSGGPWIEGGDLPPVPVHKE